MIPYRLLWSEHFYGKENFFKTYQFINSKLCHGYVLIKDIFTTKVKREPGIENLPEYHSNSLTIDVSIQFYFPHIFTAKRNWFCSVNSNCNTTFGYIKRCSWNQLTEEDSVPKKPQYNNLELEGHHQKLNITENINDLKGRIRLNSSYSCTCCLNQTHKPTHF